MPRLLHGWVILLSFISGCATAPLQLTSQIKKPPAMKSVILKNIPRGSSITSAQDFMEREGFKCWVKRDGSFSEQGVVHEGVDFLYCDRRDPSDSWVVTHRWQVAVVLEDDRVSDVYVSDGLIGP